MSSRCSGSGARASIGEHEVVCLGGVNVRLILRGEFTAMVSRREGGVLRKPLTVSFVDPEYLYLVRLRALPTAEGPMECLLLPSGSLARNRIAALGCWLPDMADHSAIAEALDAAVAAGLRVGMVCRSEADSQGWLDELWPDSSRAPSMATWVWRKPEDRDCDPAKSILAAGIDVMLVDLGRPRQDEWIARRASDAGAHVYIGRPGTPFSRRLLPSLRTACNLAAHLPRALLGGHLLATKSHVVAPELTRRAWATQGVLGRFVGVGEDADVCALVVTFRSADHVDPLIASLRAQANRHRMRVVVVDNHSDDGTLEKLRQHADVVAIDSGANLGYAGALNLARQLAQGCSTILVLNPDLVLQEGALTALMTRLEAAGGGVVVPRILDDCGAIQPSLRREPTWLGALGDAIFGSVWPTRPESLSELVLDPEAYRHPSTVDWATGATMLIDQKTNAAVGPWDERFFLYSEEVDYFRRVRQLGCPVWYEPRAIAWHHGGGSSANPALVALLAVNRVRYFEKWHGWLAGLAFRLPVALGEIRRGFASEHRVSAAFILGLRPWDSLMRAESATSTFLAHGSADGMADNAQ